MQKDLQRKLGLNLITKEEFNSEMSDLNETQKSFLLERPATDIFTILEGEKSCTNVIGRILESNKDRKQICFRFINLILLSGLMTGPADKLRTVRFSGKNGGNSRKF